MVEPSSRPPTSPVVRELGDQSIESVRPVFTPRPMTRACAARWAVARALEMESAIRRTVRLALHHDVG